jgi:hypothetical protein
VGVRIGLLIGPGGCQNQVALSARSSQDQVGVMIRWVPRLSGCQNQVGVLVKIQDLVGVRIRLGGCWNQVILPVR